MVLSKKSFKPLKNRTSNSIKSSIFSRAKLSPHLHNALKNLKSNLDIVIMPADKSLGLVVLDREWYVQKDNRQLSDEVVYKPVNSGSLDKLPNRLDYISSKYSNLTRKTRSSSFFLSRTKDIEYVLYIFSPNYTKHLWLGDPYVRTTASSSSTPPFGSTTNCIWYSNNKSNISKIHFP